MFLIFLKNNFISCALFFNHTLYNYFLSEVENNIGDNNINIGNYWDCQTYNFR